MAGEDDKNSIAVLLQPRRMEDDRSFSYQNLACGIDNVLAVSWEGHWKRVS